jgi:hypothetical protein
LATPSRTTAYTREKTAARTIPANGKKIAHKSSNPPLANAAGNGKMGGKMGGKIGGKTAGKAGARSATKPEAKILFQKFFHSVGPRTYGAQVKELGNGNHLLVLTEGKRDADTGEVRKTRLLVFGEDFTPFFKLLAETAGFIRGNPLSEEFREKRRKFWAKKNKEARAAGRLPDE